MKRLGYLIAALAGMIPSLSGPAGAADNGTALTVISPGAVERPLPVTEAGVVILHGSNPAQPNVSPAAVRSSGNGAAIALSPPVGWDRDFDTTISGGSRGDDTSGFDRSGYHTSGIDRRAVRNYDTTGFDHGFDRSGLSRP
jgi:hypothetical protein